MSNAIQTTGEALPAINRRRMLLGLAAASTAAAVVTVDAVAAPAENPDLIRLAAELPALVKIFHDAQRAYDEWEDGIYALTPWAPDELTVPGTAWPYDDPKQPGETEIKALGGYLWRRGEQFPRRIVVRSWRVSGELMRAKAALRKARKNESVSDCMVAEDEVGRLTKLLKVAAEYEKSFQEIKERASREHKGRSTWELQGELEEYIAAIMATPDWTMEGLIIKAQALAEWDRVGGKKMHKVPFRHGADWHGQIAASILRHAKGGAA